MTISSLLLDSHQSTKNADDVDESDLTREFDHFFELLAEKQRIWQEECDSGGEKRTLHFN